jgi:Flp pilus assembly protein TadG
MTRLARRRLAAAKGGATSVEFAIIFPAFFLLLFGVFEFAHFVWAVNTLQYAVAQGARYAMTSGTSLPTSSNCASTLPAYKASVQTNLKNQLAPYLSPVSVPLPTGSCGTSTVTLTLTASYSFNFILSSLVPLGKTLSQTATVTVPLS